MPTRRHGPAYGLVEADDLGVATRRRFLQAGTLVLGFAWGMNKAWAQGHTQGEEPSLQALTPGGPSSGAAFSGFQPGGFIRIPRTGKITFIIPSVEMGQGIYTGQSMMMADELEVALDQIEVMAAPPNELLYAQPILKSQATGGSTSTRGAWGPMRQAAAAARTMLIAAAAQRWGVDPSTCFADQGRVYSCTNGQSLTYGALVDVAAKLPVPKNVPLKQPGQFKLIGRSLQRVDTPSKVNGSAQFGIDAQVPGMKYAAVEICPVQGGAVAAVDDRAARAVPGVITVLRGSNAVAVVADHFWTARKAVEALDITWNFQGHEARTSDRLWDELRDAADNGKPILGRAVGDVDRAMNDAHSQVDSVYELPFLAHATMEPINTTIHVRPGECELWFGTQVPTAAQGVAAKALGIPPEKVIINNYLLGGGFGRRLTNDNVGQAVEFGRQVPFPLKIIWTREQDIRHDLYRPAYYDRISAGLAPNGLPVAWTHRTTGGSVLGTYLPTGLAEGQLDSDAVEGAAETPYDIPALRVDWIRRDPGIKVNWWRGVGPTHNVFVVESFIDELAHSVGRDPLEYRRQLLHHNGRGLRVLNIAAERAGWGQKLPPRTGRGISLHDSFGSFLAVVCEVHVTPAGEVQLRRLTAAVDVGIAINPNSVIAQVEGGLVFGLSAALYNEITFEGGAVQQGNFNDYRNIRMNEIPPTKVYVVESKESPGGVGESGTVSAAPALGNAIFAATGVRLRRLPFKRDELMDKDVNKSVLAAAVPTAIGLGAALAAGRADKADAGEAA